MLYSGAGKKSKVLMARFVRLEAVWHSLRGTRVGGGLEGGGGGAPPV
jgi:hypothetical protein